MGTLSGAGGEQVETSKLRIYYYVGAWLLLLLVTQILRFTLLDFDPNFIE